MEVRGQGRPLRDLVISNSGTHLQSQLGSLDSGHIATWTGSDDHQVHLLAVRVVTAAEGGGESWNGPEGACLSLE